MGLWSPLGIGEYQKRYTNVTAPAAVIGTSITQGVGVEGSWTEVMTAAEVTFDVYAISIYFGTGVAPGDARDLFDDVGIDPAGGSNYTAIINNLLATGADVGGNGPPQCYYFPIFIPAGSSIAIRSLGGTGGSHEAWVQIFGKLKESPKTWVGTECLDFVPGTAITVGTTSDGTWLSLGTVSKPCHWWQAGMGISDSTLTNGNVYFMDVAYGDSSNKNMLIQNMIYTVTTVDESLGTNGFNNGIFRTVPAGVDIYVRVQCSGTPDSSVYAGVYGLR